MKKKNILKPLLKNIWCHAKTSDALSALKKIEAHYFWHQDDDYTITSKGYFWTYPGVSLKIECFPKLEILCDSFKYHCMNQGGELFANIRGANNSYANNYSRII